MKKLFKNTMNDLTYQDKLGIEDRKWLKNYSKATALGDTDAMAEISGVKAVAKALFKKAVGNDARSAARKDIMNNGCPVHERTPTTEGETSYTVDDMIPYHTSESNLIQMLDVSREFGPKYFSDYGDNVTDLLPGEAVQVCMTNHYYEKCTGIVLERRGNGDYLIEIQDKYAPKGNGRNYSPENIRGKMWVKPEALRRRKINLKAVRA